MQFYHSFTHNLISFSFDGAFTSNKITQIYQKKVENNRKPISAVSNQQQSLSFATHAPYIFPCIFFSQTLSSRLSLHLLHGTTYLSHVILEMRPDLIMVTFRITRHTWKRLPASMLALVNRMAMHPPKSECATIHMQVHRRTETKRTRMNIAVDQRHP